MKRFVIKILLFVLAPVLFIILASIFAIVLPTGTRVLTYYLAFGTKQMDMLLATVESPRIIFVGGSSVNTGLNGQIIKDSLGLNPINAGLHAGLGLKYMLDNTHRYVKKGDVVVVAPEYVHFQLTPNWVSEVLVEVVIKLDRSKISLLSFKQMKNSLPHINKLIRNSLEDIISTSVDKENIYRGESFMKMKMMELKFNEYGDYYGLWDLDYQNFLPYELDINFYNSEVMENLKKLEKKIHKKGAVLYVSYPPYENESFDIGIETIKKIEHEYMRYGFALLGTPEKYRMDSSLMSDTPYHPNGTGVVLRTELVIEDLKEAGIGVKF